MCSVSANAFQPHILSDVSDDPATVIERITAYIVNPLGKGSTISAVTMPNWNVAFRIEVENYSSQNLTYHQAVAANGDITQGWPRDTNSGTREALAGRRQRAVALGCWGTVSWTIGNTQKMLVVMYYIPYSSIYNCMLAVGIFTKGNTKTLSYDMYYNQEKNFKRKEGKGNDDIQLLYGAKGVTFVIRATMPYSYKPQIKIQFYPTTVDRIASALKANISIYQCQYTLQRTSYYLCLFHYTGTFYNY